MFWKEVENYSFFNFALSFGWLKQSKSVFTLSCYMGSNNCVANKNKGFFRLFSSEKKYDALNT
jgi:hypothetical protein